MAGTSTAAGLGLGLGLATGLGLGLGLAAGLGLGLVTGLGLGLDTGLGLGLKLAWAGSVASLCCCCTVMLPAGAATGSLTRLLLLGAGAGEGGEALLLRGAWVVSEGPSALWMAGLGCGEGLGLNAALGLGLPCCKEEGATGEGEVAFTAGGLGTVAKAAGERLAGEGLDLARPSGEGDTPTGAGLGATDCLGVGEDTTAGEGLGLLWRGEDTTAGDGLGLA